VLCASAPPPKAALPLPVVLAMSASNHDFGVGAANQSGRARGQALAFGRGGDMRGSYGGLRRTGCRNLDLSQEPSLCGIRLGPRCFQKFIKTRSKIHPKSL
jgi:hypothetical protein